MAEDLCAPLDDNVSSPFCSSFGGISPLEVEYTVPLKNGTNVSVWIPTSLQSSAAKRERHAFEMRAHSLLGLIRSWCWLCRSERDVQGEVRRLRNAEGVLHELHEDQGLELGDHARDHAEAAGRAAGCRQQPRRVHHRRPLCAPGSPLRKLSALSPPSDGPGGVRNRCVECEPVLPGHRPGRAPLPAQLLPDPRLEQHPPGEAQTNRRLQRDFLPCDLPDRSIGNARHRQTHSSRPSWAAAASARRQPSAVEARELARAR